MVEVYFYVPAERAEEIAACGIKLSEWHNRVVNIGGEPKKRCIAALLNPRDDIAAYKSPEFRCIKLEVNPKYCYIAEGFYYRLDIEKPEIKELYEKSVIPVGEYIFGKYRMPECLILSTVIGDSINVLDGKFDSLILFNNSEDLYFSNVLERMKEEHEDFNDATLYYLLDASAAAGDFDKIEDAERSMAVFKGRSCSAVYALKIPDISKYGREK